MLAALAAAVAIIWSFACLEKMFGSLHSRLVSVAARRKLLNSACCQTSMLALW